MPRSNSMTILDLKGQILAVMEAAFKSAFSQKPSKIELEFPPNIEFGDFAVAFFSEANELGMAPAEIAKKVAESTAGEIIESATAVGPYINLKIKNDILFEAAISEILELRDEFGVSNEENNRKIMVEYLSPNTNKPLHLGHIRNGALGMSLSNILSSQGADVIKANLTNDRGVHISKSMLAWQKWGKGETPESVGMKGDHFVGKWYVKYASEEEKNPDLKKEAQNMLKKWEEGDQETRDLWKKMNGWVYSGFNETYEKLDFRFDKFYFESETYQLGKDIIDGGVKKGIFEIDENGNTVYNLPENFGLDQDGRRKKVTVRRKDGTSVYITQDIGTTIKKFEDNRLDQAIWVVGSEQNYYFQTLFEVLKALGYLWADKCYHSSYAMVYLPEGKMKSREGNVVDADNLLADVQKLVGEEIKKRNPALGEKELDERAKKIAVGAIKFHMLRYRPTQDIHFDPKESIALDGFTGPYCQYAYARIHGILRNAEEKQISGKVDFSLLEKEEERQLIRKLISFPDALKLARVEMNPLRVTTQVYEITKAFNQFYNASPVLTADSEGLVAARIELIKATAIAIKKGLNILGIEVLERM